jgi:hypothetical protein
MVVMILANTFAMVAIAAAWRARQRLRPARDATERLAP